MLSEAIGEVDRRISVRFEDDGGDHALSPLGVVDAVDSGFGDGGVVFEDGFDLGGMDILTATDDHRITAPEDVEVAVGVEVTEVSESDADDSD